MIKHIPHPHAYNGPGSRILMI